MHHLLLGLDPTPLGVAPFALATDHAVDLPAASLDLDLHPNARAYLLPCIAGHVGADTAGVLLAETPWDRDDVTLIIDVGTNAESCWEIDIDCWRLPVRPVRLSKGPRLAVGSERRPAPSNGYASIR